VNVIIVKIIDQISTKSSLDRTHCKANYGLAQLDWRNVREFRLYVLSQRKKTLPLFTINSDQKVNSGVNCLIIIEFYVCSVLRHYYYIRFSNINQLTMTVNLY
jgi:hypothetical protein